MLNRSKGVAGISLLTLSPQIVMRDQVRTLCKMRIVVFQVLESDISRRNLLFCNSLGNVFRPGTWKFNVVDLKRYGRGGLDDIV